MLGMSEWGLVQLVLVQALTYVLPGWLMGLAGAQAILSVISYVLVCLCNGEVCMLNEGWIKLVLVQALTYVLV